MQDEERVSGSIKNFFRKLLKLNKPQKFQKLWYGIKPTLDKVPSLSNDVGKLIEVSGVDISDFSDKEVRQFERFLKRQILDWEIAYKTSFPSVRGRDFFSEEWLVQFKKKYQINASENEIGNLLSAVMSSTLGLSEVTVREPGKEVSVRLLQKTKELAFIASELCLHTGNLIEIRLGVAGNIHTPIGMIGQNRVAKAAIIEANEQIKELSKDSKGDLSGIPENEQKYVNLYSDDIHKLLNDEMRKISKEILDARLKLLKLARLTERAMLNLRPTERKARYSGNTYRKHFIKHCAGAFEHLLQKSAIKNFCYSRGAKVHKYGKFCTFLFDVYESISPLLTKDERKGFNISGEANSPDRYLQQEIKEILYESIKS